MPSPDSLPLRTYETFPEGGDLLLRTNFRQGREWCALIGASVDPMARRSMAHCAGCRRYLQCGTAFLDAWIWWRV